MADEAKTCSGSEKESIISSRIHELRKFMEMSQDDFAALCGYSPSYVSRVERGSIAAAPRFLEKICASSGVSEDWLLGRTDRFPDELTEWKMKKNSVREHADPPGERVRQVRMENGLSIRAFAQILQASTNSVVSVEKGVRLPTRQYAKRIEEIFDVSADWLLYGDEASKNYPCGDEMIAFLKQNEDLRKMVWKKMREEKSSHARTEK